MIEFVGIPDGIIKERQSILDDLSAAEVKIHRLSGDITLAQQEIDLAREAAEDCARNGDPEGRDSNLRKIPRGVQQIKRLNAEGVELRVGISEFESRWKALKTCLCELVAQREKEFATADTNLKSARECWDNSRETILGRINQLRNIKT